MDLERRAHEIFCEALELPDAGRAAFVDEKCADDRDLLREVRALLSASERADRYFSDLAERAGLPTGGPAAPTEPSPPIYGVDRQIGPYRLLRRLGAGGMGTVFLAERETDEFRQEVALKVLTPGVDNAELRKRFLQETRILARLEHAGIARFIDAGVADDGHPYYAMEHVFGQPLLEYCDDRELSVRERLKLFLDVCEPVRFAHAQLIVHRDIKPSNILVTPDAHVKLLDFGIAKAIDPGGGEDDTRTTPFCTPAYASPEQVRGEPATTLSDVYSLGVVLYELLSGHRPYALTSLTPAQMQTVVCEVDPDRPSTVVTRDTLGSETGGQARLDARKLAQLRSATPERLRRLLAGDLDCIVLKALSKDPQRRYVSADQLADDVRNYLGGHPVRAQPDSLGYRGRKFVRRHRVGVVASSLILLSVVAGTVATVWQAQRASTQAALASDEAEKARTAAAFMADIFRLSDPNQTLGDTVTVRHMLDEGAARLQTELGDQPLLQAELLTEVANVYRNLGLLDRAESLVRRALELQIDSGADGLAISLSRSRLGDVLADQGRRDEAIAEYETVLALREDTPFPDSVKAHTQVNLAWELRELQRYEEAEVLFRAGLDIQRALHGDVGEDVMSTYLGLVAVLHDRGSLDAADSLFAIVLARQDTSVGRPHPLAATALINIGLIRRLQDRYAEATRLTQLGADMHMRLYDPGHPDRVDALNEWGMVLNSAGRHREAVEVLEGAIREADEALGSEHPQAVSARDRLALALTDLGAYDRATALHDSALGQRVLRFGDSHAETVASMIRTALPRIEAGQLDEAEVRLNDALEIAGAGSYRLQVLEGLGRAAHQRGQLDSAVALLSAAIEIGESSLRDNHRLLQNARRALASVLLDQGRREEVVDLLAGVLEVEQASRPSPHYRIGATLVLMARVELARGDVESGIGLLGEALSQFRELPADHPRVRAARRMLEDAESRR